MTDKKPIKNESEPSAITFTTDSFARFKRHYAHAVETGRKTFTFDGHGLLTEYAKYLIEHIEGRSK